MLWTSTANLIQASSQLQLHTMLNAAAFIKNRQHQPNKSSFMNTSGLNDREQIP